MGYGENKTMITLKQLLKKKSIWYFNASPQTNDFLEKEIISGVREWLLQKRQKYTEDRLTSITNDAIEYYTAKEITISQLLEELK